MTIGKIENKQLNAATFASVAPKFLERPTSAEFNAAIQDVFGSIPEKMTQAMIDKLAHEKGPAYALQLTKNMDEVESFTQWLASDSELRISTGDYKKYIASRD